MEYRPRTEVAGGEERLDHGGAVGRRDGAVDGVQQQRHRLVAVDRLGRRLGRVAPAEALQKRLAVGWLMRRIEHRRRDVRARPRAARDAACEPRLEDRLGPHERPARMGARHATPQRRRAMRKTGVDERVGADAAERPDHRRDARRRAEAEPSRHGYATPAQRAPRHEGQAAAVQLSVVHQGDPACPELARPGRQRAGLHVVGGGHPGVGPHAGREELRRLVVQRRRCARVSAT